MSNSANRICVIGGGLAGLSAASLLSEQGLPVDIFEARRFLGGRAGSFHHGESQELIDHCQHVAMGCCTSFLEFCDRTNCRDLFRRDRTLHFFAPNGRRYDLRSAPLPAPLHLAPFLLRVGYLTFAERWRLARGLLRLARVQGDDTCSIGEWLLANGQSDNAIARFWGVVLVSALGESLERASLLAARKVFVDGFLTSREAYELHVPAAPLGAIYDRVANWLAARDAELHLSAPVSRLRLAARNDQGESVTVHFRDRPPRDFSYAVLAVDWRRAAELVEGLDGMEHIRAAGKFESAPITSVHLWFDRPVFDLPHAVLVDQLSQWLFSHGPTGNDATAHHYQVVISASRNLTGRDRQSVLQEVLADLAQIAPASTRAKLLRSRMVTQPNAVFSYKPGLDDQRPAQRTRHARLMLAGDWTDTGWPATMEGAVRSGQLAANAILEQLGKRPTPAPSDLPRSWLARMLRIKS